MGRLRQKTDQNRFVRDQTLRSGPEPKKLRNPGSGRTRTDKIWKSGADSVPVWNETDFETHFSLILEMELVELNWFFEIDFRRSSFSVDQDWQSIKMALKVNSAPSTDPDWPEYKHAKTKKCSNRTWCKEVKQDSIQNQTTQDWVRSPEIRDLN